MAPAIVLHLSREFLFIYEFLLLLTMQSMPTLRNPLIIMAKMRRERGREALLLGSLRQAFVGALCNCLRAGRERETHPRCENHFNCYVRLMQQVPILCRRCLAMRCEPAKNMTWGRRGEQTNRSFERRALQIINYNCAASRR